MKIIFLSNFLLHHQTDFCEEMYTLCDGHFHFVATSPITEERKKLGYRDYSNDNIPYYIDGANPDNEGQLRTLIDEADTVIIGSAPWHWVEARVAAGKLVYIYSERIFKTLIASAKAILKGTVSTRFVRPGRLENVKLLCASAYLPGEMKRLRTFKGRMYRWGYFPPLFPQAERKDRDRITILFAGRLIGWKRPQYALQLAEYLKKMGVNAEIRIVGTGQLEAKLKQYTEKKCLTDMVTFTGPISPAEVRREMENADIFLFTSNKEEGWGAVLNEAMNSGCAVVASDRIGSVPFMLQDGQNGIMFRDGRFGDFKKKVYALCRDPKTVRRLGQNAFETVNTMWNGKAAAHRMFTMTEHFLRGEDTPFDRGPCSRVD